MNLRTELRTKTTRPAALLLLVLPGILVAGTGCRDNPEAAGTNGAFGKAASAESLLRVQTVTAEPQDLEQRIEVPGTVDGFETAELFAKVGGYLDEIFVDIGDRVEKGSLLAKLSIPEMEKELLQKKAAIAAAESDVEQARAVIRQAEAQEVRAAAQVEEARTELDEKQSQLEYRQAEFDRIKGLVERGSVNAELLDEIKYRRSAAQAALNATGARIRTAEAEREAAVAGVEKARTDYTRAGAYVDLARADFERTEALARYAEIRAPFNGVITKRMVDPGAFIQPAEGNSAARPLLAMTRIDIVRIALDLPMAQVRWLNKGDRAVLDRISVLPGERFDGEVTRFATVLDRDSRMMRVEIDLNNDDRRLMPGYYGYVTLYLDRFLQTPVVPSSALMAQGNETFVFVVKNGICQKRPVTTNYQDGSIVGIHSGLAAGEQVVQAGAGQLVDGQQVVAVGEASGT